MIPNVHPKVFSGSAVAVGYILIDDMTANEQNALGNWLMLIAQVLSTNAFYQQVQEERGNKIKNSTNSGKSTNYNGYYSKSNASDNDSSKNGSSSEIDMLKKMVEALQKEITNLEKK